jgi:predicted ATP-grasp superfamily ATP-dependent carboligase
MTQTIDPATVRSALARALGELRSLPPAILLGGEANALSVARSLGRLGAKVYALNEPDAPVCFSRYCRRIAIPTEGGSEESWRRFLLGGESEPLRGAVVLACSDAGIQVIARNREALTAKYRLDESEPVAQLCMLDKLSTYRVATAAGVPTPRYWTARSREQVESLRQSLVFPLLVKPRLSHLFEERFGRKYVFAESFDELLTAHETTESAGVEVMLVECIPGPDDRLCSYYTYLDAEATPLFHFTKRIIRRYPVSMGTATYHVTDSNPEARELGLRLFRQAGLRGLANVEFKRDERDGRLKLIKCNARFTASNGLVADSGFDLAGLVYRRIVGLPQERMESYEVGLRLWDPVRDFQAYRELRKAGRLTFVGWLSSVLRRQTFPYFRWSDPLPALARAARPLRKWRGRGAVSGDGGRRCPTS